MRRLKFILTVILLLPILLLLSCADKCQCKYILESNMDEAALASKGLKNRYPDFKIVGMEKVCEPEANQRLTGILESITFTDSEGDKFYRGK